MDTSAFISHLTAQPAYSDQIVHMEHIPPREASHGELEQPLVPALQDSLMSIVYYPSIPIRRKRSIRSGRE